MKKMNINMSKSQFEKLIKLCRISQHEISGVMNTQSIDGEICILNIKLDERDIIESANSHEIIYNSSEYITKTIYELASANSPVYIIFHTHPSFGSSPCLSKPDTDNLKYIQSLTKKVANININADTKVIEAIITRSEIVFYTYDLDNDEIIRLPFFVDGVERVPSFEKGRFQAFKEGFLEGRKKARK